MYVVIGASGNTGKVVAETLLAGGQKVRVTGRDAKRLAPLVEKGAEAFVADVTDAATLAGAFAGAKAAFLLIPPNLAAPDVRGYQERVSDAAVAAIEQAGLEHAVLLSSIGADKAERTGPVVGLHRFERKLAGIAKLNALFLRAGYFMENLLQQIGVIKAIGSLAGPLRPDLRLPLIATRDIGAYAADALQKLDFQGNQTRELLGQRDVNYTEAASLIGQAIGKPHLRYMQFPASQLKPILVRTGMSASVADALLEMSDALNSGYMTALEARSPANTTPTAIERFVEEEFVPRFRGKGAVA